MRTVLLLLSLLLPCLLVGCGVVDLPDTVGAPAPSPTMAGPSTTDPAPIERPTTWSTPAWSASEGCSAAGATVHEGEQPPYSGTGSAMDRVHLIDNPSAQDPTWEELVSFLLADGTDRKD